MSVVLEIAAFAIERDNLCLVWPRRSELHLVWEIVSCQRVDQVLMRSR